MAHAGPFDVAALRYLIGEGILFVALMLSRQSQRPPPVLLAWRILHEPPSAMEFIGIVFLLLELIAVRPIRLGKIRRR